MFYEKVLVLRQNIDTWSRPELDKITSFDRIYNTIGIVKELSQICKLRYRLEYRGTELNYIIEQYFLRARLKVINKNEVSKSGNYYLRYLAS